MACGCSDHEVGMARVMGAKLEDETATSVEELEREDENGREWKSILASHRKLYVLVG